MILTGESILPVMIQPDEISFAGYLTIFISFAMMYAIKLLYFESHAPEECNALNEIDVPRSLMFVFYHLPLGFASLDMDVGFELVFFMANVNEEPVSFRILLSLSLSITISTMLFIRTSHEKFIWSRISCLRFLSDIIIWCFSTSMAGSLLDPLLVDKYETKAQRMKGEESPAEFL